MPVPSPALLEPQWFFPLFVAGWFGVSATLSYLAGWPGLVSRFRSTHAVEGEPFRFASGSIGASSWFPVSYRSCLFFTVGETGLLVSVFFPFRFLSPPLFIPWTEVESIDEKRFWFVPHAVIHIRGSATKIMVPGPAGQRIIHAYALSSRQTAL
jgi:hypothetical protein